MVWDCSDISQSLCSTSNCSAASNVVCAFGKWKRFFFIFLSATCVLYYMTHLNAIIAKAQNVGHWYFHRNFQNALLHTLLVMWAGVVPLLGNKFLHGSPFILSRLRSTICEAIKCGAVIRVDVLVFVFIRIVLDTSLLWIPKAVYGMVYLIAYSFASWKFCYVCPSQNGNCTWCENKPNPWMIRVLTLGLDIQSPISKFTVDSGGRAIQHLHLGYQCWIPVERSTALPILSFKCNCRVFDYTQID